MTTSEKYLQGLSASGWMQLRNYSRVHDIGISLCIETIFIVANLSSGYEGPFGMSEARQYILHRYRNGAKWQTVNGDDRAIPPEAGRVPVALEANEPQQREGRPDA
jgi:hypothetical protein